MILSSEPGNFRVVLRFAFLPARFRVNQKLIGGKVWLEWYESHEQWCDEYLDGDYRWRVTAILPATGLKSI